MRLSQLARQSAKTVRQPPSWRKTASRFSYYLVGRFHVTLGKNSIGFHKTEEGAKALAAAHANQVSLAKPKQSFAIIHQN